jgi:hypothetical protein
MFEEGDSNEVLVTSLIELLSSRVRYHTIKAKPVACHYNQFDCGNCVVTEISKCMDGAIIKTYLKLFILRITAQRLIKINLLLLINTSI